MPTTCTGPVRTWSSSFQATLGDGGPFTAPVPYSTNFGSAGVLVPLTPSTVGVGAADGTRIATAGWDGGPTARVTFRVDGTAPYLTLFIEDAGRPWRRDESPRALLVGNEPLDPSSAGAAILGVAVSTAAPLSDCVSANLVNGVCADPSTCACLRLDLVGPPLAGISANWATDAGAKDVLGNGPASVAGPLLPVTRIRWQRTALGGAILSSPAIGSDGTVFFGTASGTAADRLYALSPVDGSNKWSVGVGTVQSVSVAPPATLPDGGTRGELLAFAANHLTAGATLGALQAQDGGPAFPTACQPAAAGTIYSGIGLGSVDFGFGAEWVAVGAISDGNDANARPYGYRLSTGTCLAPAADTNNVSAPPTSATAPVTNVGIDGATAYFQGKDGRLFAFALSSSTGWTSLGTEMRAAGAGGGSVFPGMALFGTPPRKLALGGGFNMEDMHFLTTATPFNNGVFTVTSVGTRFVGLPAVFDNSLIVAGVNRAAPSIDRFAFPDAGVVGGPAPAGGIYPVTSPVLASNGLGYAVDPDGGVTAFSTGPWSAMPVWTGVVPGAQSVIASPTLDCLRSGSGTGLISPLGVLYIASTAGSLTAVLVDSPKVDPAAQWPKYQRDSFNSGNAAVSPASTCP